MNPLFNICSTVDCKIRITDHTQEDGQYIPENIDETNIEGYYQGNKFKYSETYTINIIERTTTEGTTLETVLYTEHCSYLDETYYTLQKDGYYTIHHLILPSTVWLQNELNKEESILDSDISIYVTDGNAIYLYKDNTLIEQDPSVIGQINTDNTTISRNSGDTFSICYLYKCYINLCKQIFESMNIRCLNQNDNLSDLIFKRDFLWMTINVIKYYTEFNNLLEAERILESVNYCNGFCSEYKVTKNNNSCGCSR